MAVTASGGLGSLFLVGWNLKGLFLEIFKDT